MTWQLRLSGAISTWHLTHFLNFVTSPIDLRTQLGVTFWTEKHNSEMKSLSLKLYSSIMKPFTASLSGSRNFCQQLPPFKMTPAIRQKNLITAVSLLAGVFGVYYLAMFKMKETDDLESIIAVETLESDIKRWHRHVVMNQQFFWSLFISNKAIRYSMITSCLALNCK